MRISAALGWDENVLFAVTAFYCALADQGEKLGCAVESSLL